MASQGKTVTVQGRLVSVFGGNLWKGSPKMDDRTRQPVIDPNTNQPIMEYGFMLAVPKHLFLDPQGQVIQQSMLEGQPGHFYKVAHDEAYGIYPNGVPEGFAWKWRDGDTTAVDKRGNPYSARTGYNGHWILTCSTRIPYPIFKYESAYVQLTDGVNAGDYVTIQLSIKAHPAVGNSKPGLYLNPTMMLLSQKGEPIVSANRDPSTGFGAAPQAPASWMVPASNQAPANFNQFAQGQQPSAPPMGQPGLPPGPQYGQTQPPGAPQAPAQPHYGVLPPAHQPAAPGPSVPFNGHAVQPNQMPPGMPMQQMHQPVNPMMGNGPAQPAAPQFGQMPQYGSAPGAPMGVPNHPGTQAATYPSNGYPAPGYQ